MTTSTKTTSCSYRLGPCADPTYNGHRCGAPTTSGDRCDRHTFGPRCQAGCGTVVDDEGDICEPCFTGEHAPSES